MEGNYLEVVQAVSSCHDEIVKLVGVGAEMIKKIGPGGFR